MINLFFVGIWCSCSEGQFQLKVASKNNMINYDSSYNDYQMELTIGLLETLKDALKIHSVSEESDHLLDYSLTCSTTLDNPGIRSSVQN